MEDLLYATVEHAGLALVRGRLSSGLVAGAGRAAIFGLLLVVVARRRGSSNVVWGFMGRGLC